MPDTPIDRQTAVRRVIHLVRHGESQANVAGVFDSGTIDAPLTPLGQEQARRVGLWAAGQAVTRIYTSPLRRARETSVLIAAPGRLPVVVQPLLAETRMGRWDGRPIREVMVEEAEAYQAWHEDPGCAPPGGEGMAELAARMSEAVRRMAASIDGPFTLLAVSHGDPILGLLLATLGAPYRASRRVVVPNAVRLTLTLDEAGRASLEGWGCV